MALWAPRGSRSPRLSLGGFLTSGSFLFVPYNPLEEPAQAENRPFPKERALGGRRVPGRGGGPRALSYLGMWVEVPCPGAPGIVSWAGARGSRQVSAPEAPLSPPHHSPEPHSPSFYGEWGGGERLGPWIPTAERGPSAAAGDGGGGRGRPAFALFGVAALGAALCCRWGPRGESASAAAPPLPVRCRRTAAGWHGRVGKLEGGARRAPAGRLCWEPGVRRGWISLPA